MLIGKINTSIWFRCMKMKTKGLKEHKRNNKAQSPSLVGTPKAYLTGEFVVVL